MNQDQTRLLAALSRTFAEISNATLKLIAYNALCKEKITFSGMSFFVIAQHALYNDMIAHAIRVLDEHRDVAAFWYIHKCHPRSVETGIVKAGLDIQAVRATSAKLRHIREKTHFHIDRATVHSSARVWQNAGVTGDEFSTMLKVIAEVLSDINVEILHGQPMHLTDYNGTDIPRLVGAFEKVYGKVHGEV